ncbi:MAG: DUF1549 and DUF1553 domain-containing protein [Pirellulales bacterium]
MTIRRCDSLFRSTHSARYENLLTGTLVVWLCLSLCAPVLGEEVESPSSPQASESPPIPAEGVVVVEPNSVELAGRRARRQLVVTLRTAEGKTIDATRVARWEVADSTVAQVNESGVVTPLADGSTELRVRLAGREGVVASVPVKSVEMNQTATVDFRTDVIAAISRAGCNQGACHGSPQGKDGFRLSLRGFDPAQDLITLTKESDARRVNRFAPTQSLILLKGAARLPHQGGRRFGPSDHSYRTLEQWIGAGAVDSTTPRKLVALEVAPASADLHREWPSQQLSAVAKFDDGSSRDVTHEAVFTTANDTSASDPAASVSADGLVRFTRTAEATVLVRYLDQVRSAQLTYVRTDPDYKYQGPEGDNSIDRTIFAKQRKLQLNPAPLSSDAVFLRRVFLDLTGGLPTEAEARDFLNSTQSDKRARLVDQLLERDEFAYFWAMKWADVMRGNRTTISTRGVHSLHRYLVRHFAEDRPFTQLAREIVTSSGNTLHRPAANFYRISPTPEDAAEGFAQLFLGVRIQCAKCHNHPFESITQTDYYSLAAFFARVKIKGKQFGLDEEIVYVDRQGEVNHPLTRTKLEPAAFGTLAASTNPDDDRRLKLADWLASAENRWFARSTANRVWYHLLGRGIVEPVDDFRETNPPSHPELLDELARQFAASGFRLKPLVRSIVNSRTYQLSAEPGPTPSREAADPGRYFTRAAIRMVTAEQAVDAVSAVVGLPDEFPGYPAGTKAIELAEGAVENNFLMSFSRPIRDAACDCAREDEPSLNEALHLINNQGLVKRIESPAGRLGKWLAENRATPEIVESLYLVALSRRPTDREKELAERHVRETGDRATGLQDLMHALVNSKEFLLRH